jgi:hypothetical protein
MQDHIVVIVRFATFQAWLDRSDGGQAGAVYKYFSRTWRHRRNGKLSRLVRSKTEVDHQNVFTSSQSVFRCLFSYPQQLALVPLYDICPLGSTPPSAYTGTIRMPLVGNGIYGTGDKTSWHKTTLRDRCCSSRFRKNCCDIYRYTMNRGWLFWFKDNMGPLHCVYCAMAWEYTRFVNSNGLRYSSASSMSLQCHLCALDIGNVTDCLDPCTHGLYKSHDALADGFFPLSTTAHPPSLLTLPPTLAS